MLFENSKQVKLSEVELDPVSTVDQRAQGHIRAQADYEEERRIFNENYPDGDSEFDMFYEILFDAIKDWLKSPSHFNPFKKFCRVAQDLCITTEMVENAGK